MTVTVPPSGTIQIAAAAESLPDEADIGDGSVSLYEDGVQMPGQATGVGSTTATAPATGPTASSSTSPATCSAGDLRHRRRVRHRSAYCTTVGAPSFVVFQTTPGAHTYELRYAFTACGCAADGDHASFRNRRLWVIPQT